ncbi:LOW QUALITY PROTEIN: hypothetical protein Cgig2_017185 [Carnegiea gigantea]|uniref:Uncharacterized protein n=1 Tax=Carnegiea gigantea TaxID=171969 RepID=A0A9Q1Q6J2_9CARY|nr:LOW QUALITY PROTEIN: hypothetical protein Cgig2_017185 [Carnegiea gigantea]
MEKKGKNYGNRCMKGEHVLTHYTIGSQVLLLGQYTLLKRDTTSVYHEWWSKIFSSLTCNLHTDSFAPPTEDDSFVSRFQNTILTPAIPLFAIPIQSICPSTKVTHKVKEHFKSSPATIYRQKHKSITNDTIDGQDKLSIGVYDLSTKRVIELPLKGVTNIMDILYANPYPTECTRESEDVKFKKAHVPLPLGSQCFPLIGRIPSMGKDFFDSQSIHDKVSYHPFDRLPSPKADFEAFMPSLFKKVQGKLDEASQWLNSKGACYKAIVAELEHMELLKDLQLLDDQKKDLNSQKAGIEHLLQETEHEIIDVHH